MRIIAVALCLCLLLSGCVYASANLIKLRGDKIKGHFGSPYNVDGDNVALTLYREMKIGWGKFTHTFAKKIKILNEREAGDIEISD